ncbi:MAG: 2-C-methyl-D-erythritol 4-phosphate cytidylyltransferase [Thermosipho sp. (in: Bacteria)]|nr:2-C-methyl-D-erythritol 4-phosphate cytidylyltransferase [Thermosipho sp. (in: thermotogales)]
MVVAILLFGGKGQRFDKNLPKQFHLIEEKTILELTIEKFLIPEIDFIVIATNEQFKSLTEKLTKKFTSEKTIYIINGGKSREHSTFNALNFLNNKLNFDDIVLIHDGVRPFITKKIISANINAAKKYGAVVTAFPSENTIGIINRDKKNLIEITQRKSTYIIQTPQTFKFGIVYNAFLKNTSHLESFTDDSSIVKKAGYDIYIVEGLKSNIKITTKEDIFIARYLIRSEKS